jgi:hypothetical protein
MMDLLKLIERLNQATAEAGAHINAAGQSASEASLIYLQIAKHPSVVGLSADEQMRLVVIGELAAKTMRGIPDFEGGTP